ncbi:MAG: HAMP domain-containing histidine kinase [Gammaproteobacteria bacterium]|nr:HAMP domain-containing histidine kinase [Gammaproteobacteria bacterium]
MALLEKKKVDLTATQFEAAHKALCDGGEITTDASVFLHGELRETETTTKVIYIPSQKNEIIVSHLKHVEEQWYELKRVALLSLRSDTYSISKNRFVRQLLDQATTTVVHMDHVVQLMQRDSEVKVRQLDILLMAMVVIGSALFFMLVLYVYHRIIVPLDDSVKDLRNSTENLELEKRHVEKASQAKSEFLSSMSHELRTPMNAILGFGQLLELDADNLSEIQRDNVKEILDAGHHLLTLINEVLDLSKIESGKLEVSMEEVQLDELLHNCISLIATQAEARQLEIIDHISCKGYTVKADYTRLKQVLVNLLSNAVKYNREQGSITLYCDVTNDQRLCIRVTDTGNGLTSKEISKLFTSFERLSAENNVEGTGIGLVITKHLVKLMGGSIGVESVPGKGATFWVELAQFN